MSAKVPRWGSRLRLDACAVGGLAILARLVPAGSATSAETGVAGRRTPRGTPGGARAARARHARDRHRHPRAGRRDLVPGTDPAPRPDRADVAAARGRHVPLLLRDRRRADPRRGDVPPRGRRPGRPPDHPHAGRPPGDAADRAGPRLPVRDRVAGPAGALERREVVDDPRPGRRAAVGAGAATDVVRRHLHREPDPRPGAAARCPRRPEDARQRRHPRPRWTGAALRRADVRLQERQVALRHRGHRRR